MKAAAGDYAGHRIEGEHDCFAMNCKELGREVVSLREQIVKLDAEMAAQRQRTPLLYGDPICQCCHMEDSPERRAMHDSLARYSQVIKTAAYTVDDGVAQPGVDELIASIRLVNDGKAGETP